MREVISIHIGQAGIQVRGKWEAAAAAGLACSQAADLSEALACTACELAGNRQRAGLTPARLKLVP